MSYFEKEILGAGQHSAGTSKTCGDSEEGLHGVPNPELKSLKSQALLALQVTKNTMPQMLWVVLVFHMALPHVVPQAEPVAQVAAERAPVAQVSLLVA